MVSAARAALALGEIGDFDDATLLIDSATVDQVQHVEETLVDAYMINCDGRSKYIGRARGVKFAMGPMLGPKVGKFGKAAPAVRRTARRFAEVAA